jgi:hypothetical protein
VKEVLYRTKHLGWGCDTHLYRTIAEFGAAFPVRLQSTGPRAIKQNRGNDGLGVWKVEHIATRTGAAYTVRILHAQRGISARRRRKSPRPRGFSGQSGFSTGPTCR